MMYGFTYRGKHSSEFGLLMNTKDRPVMPPMRKEKATAMYRDGDVDYSNSGGRIYYDDRIVKLTLTVIKPELRQTHDTVSKIVSWLSGWYDELIFDDMPYTVWLARPEDLGSIEASLHRIGKFTVQFRCKPFNRDIVGFGFEVGSIIPVGTEIPINYRSNTAISFSIGTEVEYNFNNVGDAPTHPIISIVADSHISNIQIRLNGCILTYDKSFSEISFDCSSWRAMSGGIEVTSAVSGDYPELIPGENKIAITADNSGKITIDGYPQYLYGAGGLTNA